MIPFIENLDAVILLWIQANLRGPLDGVVTFVTHLADHGYLWILIALVLVLIRKTRAGGSAAAVALACGLLITNICIKNAVARIRPYETIEGLTSLIGIMEDWSFPSGHTTASFAAATAIAIMLGKRFGIPALILALFIALSRLYVGVHYPSDVLAGVIIGVVCGVLGSIIVRAIVKAWRKKGRA